MSRFTVLRTLVLIAAIGFPALSFAQLNEEENPITQQEIPAYDMADTSSSMDEEAWQADDIDEVADLDLTELLSRTVVIESRAEESLSELVSTVRVIGREEILLYGYRDLPDILKHTLGIDYIQPSSWLNGGFRGRPGTWVDVKFLIDGQEVNLLWSGEAFLSNQYLLNNVEQVEILFGPASAVYGADAMSGVVNIVTRKNPAFGTRTAFYASGSSQGRQELGLSASVSRSRIRLNFSSAFMQMNGPDFTDFVLTPDYDGNSEARQMNFASGVDAYRDNNEAYRVQADLQAEISTGQTWSIAGFWLKNTDGRGMESLNNLLNSEDTRQKQLGVRTSYEIDLKQAVDGPPTKLRATYKYTTDAVQFQWARGYPDAGLLNVWNVEDSRQHAGSVFATTEFTRLRNRLLAGVEYEHLRIAPIHFTGRSPEDVIALSDGSEISVVGRVLFPANGDTFRFLSEVSEQTVASVFVQDEQRVADAAKVVLGARFDRSNQYGNVFNIRSGLRWSPWKSLAGRMSYNEAFVSPSIFDLSSGQDLSPVRLRTGEVGIQVLLSGQVSIQLNGFWNHFSDKIVDDETGTSRINRGTETTLGGEAEVRWHAGPLSAYAGAAYITDRDGNTPLDAAALKFIGRLSWNVWNNIHVSADSKYTSKITSEREDPIDSTMTIEHTVRDYKLLNLTLAAREITISPTSKVNISATVRNLFGFDNRFPNNRGTTPYQFIEEPRSFFLKAELGL